MVELFSEWCEKFAINDFFHNELLTSIINIKGRYNMSSGRYCLQIRTIYDPTQSHSIWKTINKCSDDLNALRPFLGAEYYRIWDTVEKKVVEFKKL